MIAGQRVTVYGNPLTDECPMGEVILKGKIGEFVDTLEDWEIEYLDFPGRIYTMLIRKYENN
jgi:hypothetical protein